MRIIESKQYRNEWISETKRRIEREQRANKRPAPILSIVTLGEPTDVMSTYIRNKEKACVECGIDCNVVKLTTTTPKNLVNEIYDICDRSTSVIVQSPSTSDLDWNVACQSIDPIKDADCMTAKNLGKLLINPKMYPATTAGVLYLIERLEREKYDRDETWDPIKGRNIVVLGRSTLVGSPTAIALIKRGANVTCFNSNSQDRDVEYTCSQADIIISAVGKPGTVKIGMVSDHATIIDIGTTYVDGKLQGDCGDLVEFEQKLNERYWYEDSDDIWVTKVPGGVGPMTVAGLMNNVADLYCTKGTER